MLSVSKTCEATAASGWLFVGTSLWQWCWWTALGGLATIPMMLLMWGLVLGMLWRAGVPQTVALERASGVVKGVLWPWSPTAITAMDQ